MAADNSDPYQPDDFDPKVDDEGGVVLSIEEDDEIDEGPEVEFYDNIIDDLPEDVNVYMLAVSLLEDIKRDKESRKDRDKQYEEAIKRTGLGKEAPGGADFQGASKAVHPMLTEACVDFSSRAIKELFPANGPANSFVPGERPTVERLKKADRKKTYMNWQFLVQMPEFRAELEQLLTQLPLGGSQYMRLIWDGRKRRPVPTFWPVDMVYLPYAASNFYTAERVTIAEQITKQEFDKRVDSGQYKDYSTVEKTDDYGTSQLPEETKSQQATDKIEGKAAGDEYNADGLRMIYEVTGEMELEDDYGLAPYRIAIDDSTSQIVSINRNWMEEDEKTKENMFWMVEFPFVPWRGAYSIGLGQMIGSLSGAATGALRALLDSAQINNFPALLRLKGANMSGSSEQLNATSITEIEGGIGGDDIRKLMMPIPYNPPSAVLMSLLEYTVNAGKGVVRTTFDDLAQQKADQPVGTTLALIEEGMRVMSAIHLRLFHAMGQVLKILHRINMMYLEDDEVKDDIGDFIAYSKDFQLPMDVVPVADPEIFSDLQRLGQMQIIEQRAQAMPDIYNLRKVEERILERTKIPNYEELLIPIDEPQEQNAVNENVAMTLGRGVAAFPEQEHLAHLQVHLQYLESPMFGQNPLIAPTFIPMVLEHIKEHMALWYVSTTVDVLQQELKKDDDEMEQIFAESDDDTKNEMSRTLATISGELMPEAENVFKMIPGVIAKAQELMQQFAPQPQQLPVDPNKQADTKAKSETEAAKLQQKEASEQRDIQAKQELEFAKLSAEEQQQVIENASKQQLQASEYVARLKELQLKEISEDDRQIVDVSSRESINRDDNLTALSIAAAEIESGEKVAVSTGAGTNPNP